MIDSWKKFFAAVEQMRECQKEYFRTKRPSALAASKKCEAAVDAVIKERRAAWGQQELLEFFYRGEKL